LGVGEFTPREAAFHDQEEECGGEAQREADREIDKTQR
jgi:hypothetical protein